MSDQTERNKIYISAPKNLLKPLIMQELHNYGKSEETTGMVASRPPISPNFDDYIQITYVFRGMTETNPRWHRAENSFRLKEVDPKTVTLQQLQEIARKSQAKFDSFTFKTGHIKVKYTEWKKGYQLWGYYSSRSEGHRVIESILDIRNHSINLALLKYEDNANPAEAFKEPAEKTLIAGVSVRTKTRAPIATMHFTSAYVSFPWIGRSEKLCSRVGYVIKDLNFLKDYDY